MVSVPQPHVWGSSSPGVWGAPLSDAQGMLPSIPKTPGKRDKQSC